MGSSADRELRVRTLSSASPPDPTRAVLTACGAIFNHAVLNGTAVWTYEPPSLEDFIAKYHDSLGKGFPFFYATLAKPSEGAPSSAGVDGSGPGAEAKVGELVSEEVVGFASANHYRPREGWRFTVENSIFVAPGQQGRGIGRRLVEALVTRCGELGFRQMVAVISVEADDPAHPAPYSKPSPDSKPAASDDFPGHWSKSPCPSVRLHGSLGFAVVARMPSVGWKFGRWLDGVMMQRALAPPASPSIASPGSPPVEELLPHHSMQWGHHPAHSGAKPSPSP